MKKNTIFVVLKKQKSMKRPTLIAITTLLALLLSLGYWLYIIYNVENNKLQEIVSGQFQAAIKLEMSGRMSKKKHKDPNNPKWFIKSASDMTPEERNKLNGDTITWPQVEQRNLEGNTADLLFQRMQDGLRNSDKPLRPTALDSIFNKLLANQNINATTLVVEYDSTRQIVCTAGKLSKHSQYKFQTELLPIGTQGLQYVQAYVKASSRITDIMQYSLIVSCLILIISTGCLYYLLKTIRKAHSRLREREMAVHSAIHDLKSPLNTAYASMDFIASLEKEPMKVKILNTGKTQIKQLIEIIESMLSLLKTADGKEIAQRSPIEIKSFIEQTYQAIARLYPNKKPLFMLEKSKDFPDVIQADTVRLERCLRNLLENALKYSNDDVRITVALTMHNNHYRIAIKDTGWGIPKKAQKKLGQQFFRVKQTDKPARPGYGLGLSSVKLLAKEMGGSMNFQSEEGVGSTFFINFPA